MKNLFPSVAMHGRKCWFDSASSKVAWFQLEAHYGAFLFLASHWRENIRLSKDLDILRAKTDKNIFKLIFWLITFIFKEENCAEIRIIKPFMSHCKKVYSDYGNFYRVKNDISLAIYQSWREYASMIQCNIFIAIQKVHKNRISALN